MKLKKSAEKFYNRLQKEIELAEHNNKPIDKLVKQQIKILQETHDEFISEATARGYNLKNQKIAEVEIKQYSAMKFLAQKIGLPIEEYDEIIKKIQVRVWGQEIYDRFLAQ